ncbi:hypothetical protein JYU34_013038, partial [Plutella xylostella]
IHDQIRRYTWAGVSRRVAPCRAASRRVALPSDASRATDLPLSRITVQLSLEVPSLLAALMSPCSIELVFSYNF